MAQFLKDEVKDKIKHSAVDVFTVKGFKKASIKEIAGHAQVSVGNVYRYYKNKDSLYTAVIEGVSEGILDILQTVEANDNYKMTMTNHRMNNEVYEPMLMFMQLYKKEKKVFRMLIKNGRDQHYEATLTRFVHLLNGYFYKFWGNEDPSLGLSRIEVSALTNALVYSVIDLLNQFDDATIKEEVLNDQLMAFTSRLISGYFWAKQGEGEKT